VREMSAWREIVRNWNRRVIFDVWVENGTDVFGGLCSVMRR
jgi:hypothetical protein